jgi:hypothetical protein
MESRKGICFPYYTDTNAPMQGHKDTNTWEIMTCPEEIHKSPTIDPKGRGIYEMIHEELGIIFL